LSARDDDEEILDAPELECTPESIKAFAAWLALMGASGRMSAGKVRDLNQVARTMQAQLRIDHGLNEMDQLKALVARMEAAVRERKRLATGDRHGGTEIGEFPAEDDDKDE
jgi:hypothetical protein